MKFEILTIMPLFQMLGLAGAFLYICNYVMLTTRIITSECLGYFVVNLCASSLVLSSLLHEFNAALAVIQSFWIVVSIVGVATRVRPGTEAGPRAAVGAGPRGADTSA